MRSDSNIKPLSIYVYVIDVQGALGRKHASMMEALDARADLEKIVDTLSVSGAGAAAQLKDVSEARDEFLSEAAQLATSLGVAQRTFLASSNEARRALKASLEAGSAKGQAWARQLGDLTIASTKRSKAALQSLDASVASTFEDSAEHLEEMVADRARRDAEAKTLRDEKPKPRSAKKKKKNIKNQQQKRRSQQQDPSEDGSDVNDFDTDDNDDEDEDEEEYGSADENGNPPPPQGTRAEVEGAVRRAERAQRRGEAALRRWGRDFTGNLALAAKELDDLAARLVGGGVGGAATAASSEGGSSSGSALLEKHRTALRDGIALGEAGLAQQRSDAAAVVIKLDGQASRAKEHCGGLADMRNVAAAASVAAQTALEEAAGAAAAAAEAQEKGRRDEEVAREIRNMSDLVRKSTDEQQTAASSAAAQRSSDLGSVSKAVLAAAAAQTSGRTHAELTAELQSMQSLVRSTTSGLQNSATIKASARTQELSAVSAAAVAAAAAQEKGRSDRALEATLEGARELIAAASNDQAATAEVSSGARSRELGLIQGGIGTAVGAQEKGRRDQELFQGVSDMHDLVQKATDEQQTAASSAAAQRSSDLGSVSKAVLAAAAAQASGRTHAELIAELQSMQSLVRSTTNELQASATATASARTQDLSAMGVAAAAAAAAQEKGRSDKELAEGLSGIAELVNTSSSEHQAATAAAASQRTSSLAALSSAVTGASSAQASGRRHREVRSATNKKEVANSSTVSILAPIALLFRTCCLCALVVFVAW